MRTPILNLMTVGALAGALAFAQQEEPDPPGRAARLSLVTGTVSFQPGGVEDWVPATVNRPFTTGDRLWTEAGARAELNTGSAEIRLNGRTNFSFINLDDRTAQIQVSQGSLSVRVRRLAEDETVEVDTPQVALTLLRPGEYRIDVNEQGDTTVATVRGGSAEANAGGQAVTLRAREQTRISGAEGAQPTIDQRDAPPSDAFDNWCMDRDRREDRSLSAKYVSRDMPGYSDLDDHGVWRQDPQYGAVWTPAGMPSDWAPYHYGHWAWISPWGWTWVDDAPWGYAPFHYGRWVFVGGGWGWVPGPMTVRPVYAPAMVAWVGGARFGVALSIGGPAVGWFPLGFGEVWVPSYHASPAYFNRVNVSNTVVNNVTVTNVYNTTVINRTNVNQANVTNVRYMNQNVPGAVTAVPHDAMVSGRPVAAAAVRVSPGAMSAAEVGHVAAVAPQRAAVLGGRAPVSAAPPAATMNRTVITRTAPPPAPVPFARQQTALQQNPGRPLDNGTVRSLQGTAPPTPRPMYRQVAPTRSSNTPAPATPAPQPRGITPEQPRVIGPAPQPRGITPEQPRVIAPAPQPRVVTPEQPRVVTPAPQPRVVTPEQPRVVTPTPQPRVVTPEQPRVVTPTPQPRVVTPEQPRAVTPAPPPRVVTPEPQPRVVTPAPPPRVVTPEPRPVQPERTTPRPEQKQEQKQKAKPKQDKEKEKEKKQQ